MRQVLPVLASYGALVKRNVRYHLTWSKAGRMSDIHFRSGTLNNSRIPICPLVKILLFYQVTSPAPLDITTISA